MANEEYNELVAALNQSLVANLPTAVEEEPQLDEFPSVGQHNNIYIFYQF